jgi:hypothetical protein
MVLDHGPSYSIRKGIVPALFFIELAMVFETIDRTDQAKLIEVKVPNWFVTRGA